MESQTGIKASISSSSRHLTDDVSIRARKEASQNETELFYDMKSLRSSTTPSHYCSQLTLYFITFLHWSFSLSIFLVSALSRCRFFDDSRCNMHVYHVVFFTLFIYLITINDVFLLLFLAILCDRDGTTENMTIQVVKLELSSLDLSQLSDGNVPMLTTKNNSSYVCM